MATTTLIKFDLSQLDDLAKRLGEVDVEDFSDRMADVLNGQANKAFSHSLDLMLQGINLTEPYVRRKMEVREATPKTLEASIVAPGGKAYTTPLSHYFPLQLDIPVTWSNARILADGHEFADWPGWTRRTGDEGRGIAADRKASGQSVEVVRGRRKRMGSMFSIPGKNDSEGNPIIFRRIEGTRKKAEALHGPSVYQLLRRVADAVAEEAEDNLAAAVIDEAESIMERLL